MPRFARVTPEHLSLIESRLTKPVRLYLHALLWSMPADNLVGWPAARFDEWLIASGRAGMEGDAFRAVDFTEGQAMEWLGSSSKRATGQAIAEAIECGLIVRIASGVKNHPSLYLIAPVPSNRYAPTYPNNLGEQQKEDVPPVLKDTPPEEVLYAPTFPNNLGDTNKSLQKITIEAQAACADKAAPPVKVGDRCPVCYQSRVATIENIMREKGTSPKKELLGELRCPSCWCSWGKDGTFKKFVKVVPT